MSAASPQPPHPDRVATTLADREDLLRRLEGPFAAPGEGSADARVDLKLLLFQARRAVAERGTDLARARLATIDSPDLLAGTVQDGSARGVSCALEEAISLCEPAPAAEALDLDSLDVKRFEGRDLRRKKDIVVASGGARIRWSRKGGLLFVDREHEVHEEDCLRFEDRRDTGDLDGFVADLDERPRLFSPGHLQPQLLVQGPELDRLELRGRLGRRGDGYACRLRFDAFKNEPVVRMQIEIHNMRDDHRLRLRLLGCRRPDAVDSDGSPPFELIRHHGRFFVAATLVRACGELQVGEQVVAVPAAQCHGWHRHLFRLGGRAWR